MLLSFGLLIGQNFFPLTYITVFVKVLLLTGIFLLQNIGANTFGTTDNGIYVFFPTVNV